VHLDRVVEVVMSRASVATQASIIQARATSGPAPLKGRISSSGTPPR
jgi:hypothetical protein